MSAKKHSSAQVQNNAPKTTKPEILKLVCLSLPPKAQLLEDMCHTPGECIEASCTKPSLAASAQEVPHMARPAPRRQRAPRRTNKGWVEDLFRSRLNQVALGARTGSYQIFNLAAAVLCVTAAVPCISAFEISRDSSVHILGVTHCTGSCVGIGPNSFRRLSLP